MGWRTVERPGYFGKKRNEFIADFNRKYGPDNWRIAYIWGERVIDREMAVQLYEDAYYLFFLANPEKLAWLINRASDVYDSAPSNVTSGLDYLVQETVNHHLQDIAIRRSMIRLGLDFRGDHLVEVRGRDSEGYAFNPGIIPFHIEEMIHRPPLTGWWRPGSVEDFYQSNKILQIKI